MSDTQYPQFLGSELTAGENNPAQALFQVIPCGLEKTVSYGTGAANGPAAILAASQQLERLCTSITGHNIEPCSRGIYTHPPVDCTPDMPAIMQNLRQLTAAIAGTGQIPVTLGGEHSVSFGAVMGVADSLAANLADSGKTLGLVHIDAHADFRDAYQGHRYSHASVMNLLAAEGLAMASFGVRALAPEEARARRAHGVICHDARQLVVNNVHAVTLPDDFPEHIYVTFDLDGLDPSVLPATGTPVPGGLGYYQALDLVQSTLVGRQCVGIDIVELAPIAGQPASDFTAAQIAYELMGLAVG
jgi:agmatinase